MLPRSKTRLPLLDRPYVFDQVVFPHRDNYLIPLLHAEVISPNRHVAGVVSGFDFVPVNDTQDAEVRQMAIAMFGELRQIRRRLVQRLHGRPGTFAIGLRMDDPCYSNAKSPNDVWAGMDMHMDANTVDEEMKK